MTNINYIINSIETVLKSNVSGIYIYNDNNIDTSKVYICNPKTNLPAGTEVTFVVQESSYGVDLKSADLKNRYVRFTNASGIDTYRLITSYTSSTGSITMASSFGMAMTTTSTFDIIVLDELFIDCYDLGSMGGREFRSKEYLRMRLILQTKEDGNKSKIYNFIDLIKTTFYANSKEVTLYSTGTTQVGTGRILDSLTFQEKVNSDNNMQSYLGTFLLEYIIKHT